MVNPADAAMLHSLNPYSIDAQSSETKQHLYRSVVLRSHKSLLTNEQNPDIRTCYNTITRLALNEISALHIKMGALIDLMALELSHSDFKVRGMLLLREVEALLEKHSSDNYLSLHLSHVMMRHKDLREEGKARIFAEKRKALAARDVPALQNVMDWQIKLMPDEGIKTLPEILALIASFTDTQQRVQYYLEAAESSFLADLSEEGQSILAIIEREMATMTLAEQQTITKSVQDVREQYIEGGD